MRACWILVGLLTACTPHARAVPAEPVAPPLTTSADAGAPSAAAAADPDACQRDTDCTMADMSSCCACCTCHTLEPIVVKQAEAREHQCATVDCEGHCEKACPACPPDIPDHGAGCHEHHCVALP